VVGITTKDVWDLVDMVSKRSSRQAHEALKLLRMLLNRALDDELIGRNPAMRIPAPSTDCSRVRVLKPWELKAVANLPERGVPLRCSVHMPPFGGRSSWE